MATFQKQKAKMIFNCNFGLGILFRIGFALWGVPVIAAILFVFNLDFGLDINSLPSELFIFACLMRFALAICVFAVFGPLLAILIGAIFVP